jgi:hypothetical protein
LNYCANGDKDFVSHHGNIENRRQESDAARTAPLSLWLYEHGRALNTSLLASLAELSADEVGLILGQFDFEVFNYRAHLSFLSMAV